MLHDHTTFFEDLVSGEGINETIHASNPNPSPKPKNNPNPMK